jgi:hypothetical protein
MAMRRRRNISESTASSWPGLSRPSTSSCNQSGLSPYIARSMQGFVGNSERRSTLDRVGGRDMPGHDGEGAAPSLLL